MNVVLQTERMTHARIEISPGAAALIVSTALLLACDQPGGDGDPADTTPTTGTPGGPSASTAGSAGGGGGGPETAADSDGGPAQTGAATTGADGGGGSSSEGSSDDEGSQTGAPPPPRAMIASIEFDWETRENLAPGSDNWPITWGLDGEQYTSWGDGGGFGGSNQSGRVSLGVARVVGAWPDFTTQNVWGGFEAEHPAQFEGKSYGMLDVDGMMYMWLRQCCGTHAKLAWSGDGSATWNLVDWDLPTDQFFSTGTFLQFGPGYDGSRDDYVYAYFIRDEDEDFGFVVKTPGLIDLVRVPRTQVTTREAYEFFAGLDDGGGATWTDDPMAREPVLEDDERGVSWCSSATYNAGLGRYLLTHGTTEWVRFGDNVIGVFEGAEPWGPFELVEYVPDVPGWTLTFSNKWTSDDGLDTVAIITAGDEWASVGAHFILEP